MKPRGSIDRIPGNQEPVAESFQERVHHEEAQNRLTALLKDVGCAAGGGPCWRHHSLASRKRRGVVLCRESGCRKRGRLFTHLWFRGQITQWKVVWRHETHLGLHVGGTGLLELGGTGLLLIGIS